MPIRTSFGLSNLALEVAGKPAGFLTSFQAPPCEVRTTPTLAGAAAGTGPVPGPAKLGEAVATFEPSLAPAILDWIGGVWRRADRATDAALSLADQNLETRYRFDLTRCLLTSVEFPVLDAADGKRAFEVTFKFQPEALKYGAGGPKLQGTPGAKAKRWLVSNWKVSLPGLESRFVSRIELPRLTAKIAEESASPARLPTRRPAGLDLGSLKLTITPAGFDAANSLVAKTLQDGTVTSAEYVDVTIDLLDPAMKTVVGTITCSRCWLARFDWSLGAAGAGENPLLTTLEFAVGGFDFKPVD